jgi:sporulation protein YlmC with PRC-barrel domain
MDSEKRLSKQFTGKKVVSKTGKEFGLVDGLVFETRTGEVLQLVLRNTTGYCEGLDLEKSKTGETLIPFSSIAAIGDFIVIAEEDLI